MLSESRRRSLKAAYMSVKAFERFQEHVKFVQKLFLEFPLKVPTKIPRKSPRKIPRFLKVTRRLINYWMSLEVCRKIFDIIFGNSPRLRKDSTSFCEGFGRIIKFSKASDSLWRILKATEVSGNRWKNSENFWRSLEAPEDSENFWRSSGNLWRTVKASKSF